MRDLLEAIDEFGHKDIVLEASKDKEIDAIVDTLGSKPNLDEIYGKLDELYKIKGFMITKGFLRRQYLGKVAVKYGLPGLYPPDKGSMISTKTDGEGLFQTGGNMKTNIELAKMGLLPKYRLEKLEQIADSATKTAERGDNPDRAKVAMMAADALKAAGNDQKAKEIEDRIVASPTGKKNPDMVAKINAKKRTAGGDDGSDQDDGAGAKGADRDTAKSASSAGGITITNDNVAKMIARYNDLIVKGKKKAESWQPNSFADQLLQQLTEALSDEETSELQNMVIAFQKAAKDENITPEYKRELNRLIGKWEQDKKDIGLFKGNDATGDEKGADREAAVDYASDEQIQKATSDVEAWIANEMPKELQAAQAKGLLKATNRGKNKSASAAAVQTVLMRIGTANNNEELKKIKADGLYGPATVAGVKRAQELAGITVDGDAGANTAKELLAYSKNPQKGIDDAMKSDFERIKELLAKSKETTQDNQSIDFRNLISIVENKLMEALSPEEMEELKGLINKHKAKLEDPETAGAYQEYADVFKQAQQYVADEEKAGADREQAKTLADLKNHQDLAKALNDAMKGGFFFGLGTDEQAVLGALGKVKDANSFKKLQATYKQMYKATLQQHIEEEFSGNDLEQVMGIVNKLGGFEGSAGASGPGGEKTAQGMDPKKLANPKPKGPGPLAKNNSGQSAGTDNTAVMASKDYGMKKALNEAASMNISMSADNSAEVAELLSILKNAGMPDAEAVADMPMYKDPHDDMKSLMSTCGASEDVDEAEWDNSPEEEYQDDDYMNNDLSGGINRRKKSYPATQDGDNPMALEQSIKSQLYKALEEKLQNK